MVETLKDAELDLADDEPFHRRQWIIERAAWVLFALVLLAAALGALGGGPLSGATASAGPMTVEYQRLARRERPVELTVRLERSPGPTVAVILRGPLFSKSQIESISPRPAREAALAEGVEYTFDATAGQPATFSFVLEPAGAGSRDGTVQVQQSSVALSMFVYP